MILWKFQNWIGVGFERKMKLLWSLSIKCLRRSYLQEERRYATGKDRHQWTRNVLREFDTTKYKHLQPSNDKFIRDVLLSLLLAGRDTTSSALTWFFWLLSKHPQVMAKIRNEIKTKFDPTDLEKLVYLHAALFESMRLYPPVPLNHKSPSKSDVLPSGHKVEADAKI
ncbi:unnamed protein product [Microthlaspi erraticum]|uniref:Cytochrome P450 n=1 Tax=Microthlaspi erraticum TaxID=1685480 RepID=A0A6D2J4L4_9BRAS|nr:unnamed protein product [Microthlaspi erraticum]